MGKESLPNTLELFDLAIERKLKKLYTNVIGTFPERAMFDSNNQSKVTLPLISFYRLSNDIDMDNYQHSELFTGYRTNASQRTRSVPIKLLYSIDLWADNRNEVDTLFYDIVYRLLIQPNISVDMGETEARKIFSIRLVEQSSSSNLFEQSLQENRIYRYTLTYSVNNARMLYQVPDGLITDTDIDIDAD